LLFYSWKKKVAGGEVEEHDFADIISVFLYTGGLCESLFFLYCGFHPASLSEMPEYPWLIMVGAITMGFHAWMQLKARFKTVGQPRTASPRRSPRKPKRHINPTLVNF
jgi:hypothetical protein